jgi:hypothetical protein
VFARTAIGVPKLTVCQPVAVSVPKVAVPIRIPALDQRCPTCVPPFVVPL